jgi:sugar phosphate isomerase/epimerase
VKLAFSTNAFKRFSLEDSIRQIGDVGYEGVEILCDIPHLYPPLLTEESFSRLSRFLGQQHLKISNLNAFTLYAVNDVYHPSWIEPDKGSRDVRITHTIDCLKAAKLLGAKNISTEGGGPQTPGMSNRRELLNLFINNLEEVVKIAENENVKILIEPEPGLIIENSSQITELLKNFDSKSIGLNCDLGHFYCVGEDPAKVVYQLADYIGHFHLADIARNRVHNHLLPGTGSINFESIFDAIRAIGYQGYVTVELYTYQDDPLKIATKAYDYLQTFL